jgi:hypothetical protein
VGSSAPALLPTPRRRTGDEGLPQALRDGAPDVIALLNGSQVHPPDAVDEVFTQAAMHRSREPGLADAASPDDADQSVVEQGGHNVVDGLFAADQRLRFQGLIASRGHER